MLRRKLAGEHRGFGFFQNAEGLDHTGLAALLHMMIAPRPCDRALGLVRGDPPAGSDCHVEQGCDWCCSSPVDGKIVVVNGEESTSRTSGKLSTNFVKERMREAKIVNLQ